MQWDNQPESANVDDRRGLGSGGRFAIGGVGGLILIGLALLFGVDPQQLLNPQRGQGLPEPNRGTHAVAPANPEDEKLAHFSKVIFHDTEIVWDDQFHRLGRDYTKPTLVLFNGRVESACGSANAAYARAAVTSSNTCMRTR